jgi:hypothetical protein
MDLFGDAQVLFGDALDLSGDARVYSATRSSWEPW